MKFIMVSMAALTVLLTSNHARAVEALSTAVLGLHFSHNQKDPEGKDASFAYGMSKDLLMVLSQQMSMLFQTSLRVMNVKSPFLNAL